MPDRKVTKALELLTARQSTAFSRDDVVLELHLEGGTGDADGTQRYRDQLANELGGGRRRVVQWRQLKAEWNKLQLITKKLFMKYHREESK